MATGFKGFLQGASAAAAEIGDRQNKQDDEVAAQTQKYMNQKKIDMWAQQQTSQADANFWNTVRNKGVAQVAGTAADGSQPAGSIPPSQTPFIPSATNTNLAPEKVTDNSSAPLNAGEAASITQTPAASQAPTPSLSTPTANSYTFTPDDYDAAIGDLALEHKKSGVQPSDPQLMIGAASARAQEIADKRNKNSQETSKFNMDAFDKGFDPITGKPLINPTVGEALLQKSDTTGYTYDPAMPSKNTLGMYGVYYGPGVGGTAYKEIEKIGENNWKDIFTPTRANLEAQTLTAQGNIDNLIRLSSEANSGPGAGGYLGKIAQQFGSADAATKDSLLPQLNAAANLGIAFAPRVPGMRATNAALALLHGEMPQEKLTDDQNKDIAMQMGNLVNSVNQKMQYEDAMKNKYPLGVNRDVMYATYADWAKNNAPYSPDAAGHLAPNPTYMDIKEWQSPNRAVILQSKLQKNLAATAAPALRPMGKTSNPILNKVLNNQ